MKLYMNLVAMNLKSQMQYRVSFLLTTLGQFITAFTSFFGLYFIFSRVNAIDDFNYNQVFLCFAVVMMAFAIGEMFGGGLAVFPRIMGNGEFDRALVRPRNIIPVSYTHLSNRYDRAEDQENGMHGRRILCGRRDSVQPCIGNLVFLRSCR